MRGTRIAGAAALGLIALELLYVLVANLVLFSGVIQREASRDPASVALGWDRAFSPWPGRVYVWGFWMRVQDPLVQFRLTLHEAKVDVVLSHLLRKKFHASHVRARGVSHRFLVKAQRADRRLAAFADIQGFSRPALREALPPTPPSQAELDALWTVQLDDVDATLSELWFLEYRYQGPANVQGAFELSPLRSLWVGPARLQLEGGVLTAGEHRISSAFAAQAEVTIAPVQLAAAPGPMLLRALSASIRFDATVEDPGVAELYRDGVKIAGTGKLKADVQIVAGRLADGSQLEVSLSSADARVDAYRFSGRAEARLSVSQQQPKIAGSLAGELAVPLSENEALATELSGVNAELVLEDNDLSNGLSLRRLFAVLGEARVRDARAVTRRVSSVVPLVAPVVLGDGPLVASATAYLTPEYALVRLKRLQLGDAELEGAAVPGARGWNGAAAGHFGKIPLGLRLMQGKLESVPFAAHPWLGVELLKAGIKPGA
jgi:hypothetical protein